MSAASRKLFTGPVASSPGPWVDAYAYSTNYHHSYTQALVVGLAALGLGMLVLVIFFIHYSRVRSNRTSPCDLTPGLRLQRFSYSELKAATDSFNTSAKLGKGGFGVVYKGVLSNGKEVAVKKLDVLSVQGEREFQNELSIVAGLRSPFTVSLLGYCADGNKRRFLVYEHMQKGSLQEALFEIDDDDDHLPSRLDWEKRFNVVVDVAQALAFLHLECDPPIIHGDIKPSNVLLDTNFRAHVADFGLARLKCDDMYYLDMFGQSQELMWKSQDLLKSQELGRNSNQNNTVAGRESKSEASDDDESDINPRKSIGMENDESNIKPKRSIGMENFDAAIDNMDEQPTRDSCLGDHELHAKGKEVVSEHLGLGGSEDWIKVCASEEETDWSKELQVEIQKKRGWWWKHDDDDDGSGELSAKDYVMMWIGSLKVKKGTKRRKRIPDEETINHTDSMTKAKGKKGKDKPRKIKEWWKEEYLAEMSKKSRKLEKIKWKHRFDRRRNSTSSRRDFLYESRDKIRSDCSYSYSMGSEMWSGDLLSRELSSTASMRGTVCYIPPEYGGCGFLSEKGDIYSFGVLMLVIVSGRRPLHVLASPMKDFEKANLISWARHLAQTGNILELVSDSLKGLYDKDQASLCITLGLLCLQRIPEMRPDISEILKILKGEMDAPPLPLEFSPSPPSRLRKKKSKKRLQSDAVVPAPPGVS